MRAMFPVARPVVAALLLGACGGSTPPKAGTAEPTPPASARPEAKPAPAASSQPEPAASTAPPEAPEASKPSRPPIDTITAPKVAYVIDYSSSAPAEAAEKRCSQFQDKPEARAACMKKERSEFVADVLQFKKDAKDKVTWSTYRRHGETLFLVHHTPVELTDATESSVTVVITGDDKGPRALFPQKKKFVVRVPNDYSIELDEPFLGKLVYDAKIDIVGTK